MWHFLQTLQMSCMYSLTDSEHTYFIQFSMQNEALHSEQYDAFLCIKPRCIFRCFVHICVSKTEFHVLYTTVFCKYRYEVLQRRRRMFTDTRIRRISIQYLKTA